MAMVYTNSLLWKRNLALQGADDKYVEARGRFRDSFNKTRKSVIPLVDKISQELPALTVHDISHLDALWGVADVLLGPDYPLNPAEAYVLGIAFLLHDAATTSFAYPDGILGIRETVEWRDFVAQRGFHDTQLQKGEPEYQLALFETLRLLHAKQATRLPTQTWKDMNGLDRFLIEDVELRNHYGRLIGRIASSHGEDPGAAENEWAFVASISPHSSLELDSSANWTVDPLKMAMLIRCIDAAHIDSLRAPDIYACLAKPTGESLNHWTFQNKLSALAISPKNELYWSSSNFDMTRADAWWRCYETCQMIHREIDTANRILADHKRPLMRAVGVMGATDIDIFKRNVPVEGWHPLDFNFKVSQIGEVIEKFGGEKLYGDRPYLALRELIQNSADAIRARRLQTGDAARGRIDIRLRCDANANWWLDVQDDGLGMSRFVLTEVLLDFGRSLWKDAALRNQWTGLTSKGFKAVGQFGIGFFSVFMLGDEVKVTSWRYGSSIDEQLTLHLRQRVRERPILLETDVSERLLEPGTKVSIRLKAGRASLLREVHSWKAGSGAVTTLENLDRLVGHLAPASDIDIWTVDGTSPTISTVKADDWKIIPGGQLLSRLALDIVSANAIKHYGDLLTDLVDEVGEVIGRAALYADDGYSHKFDFGTLVHRGILAGRCSGVIGILVADNSHDLARSKADPCASGDALRVWAKKQYEIAQKSTPRLSERLVSLDVAEKNLIVGRLNGSTVTSQDLVNFFEAGGAVELFCVTKEIECPEDISQKDFEKLCYYENVLDLTGCSPDVRFDFGMSKWLGKVLPSELLGPTTILQLVEHFLTKEVGGLCIDSEPCEIAEVEGAVFTETCVVFRVGSAESM